MSDPKVRGLIDAITNTITNTLKEDLGPKFGELTLQMAKMEVEIAAIGARLDVMTGGAKRAVRVAADADGAPAAAAAEKPATTYLAYFTQKWKSDAAFRDNAKTKLDAAGCPNFVEDSKKKGIEGEAAHYRTFLQKDEKAKDFQNEVKEMHKASKAAAPAAAPVAAAPPDDA